MFKLKKLFRVLMEPMFIEALLSGAAAGVEHKSALLTLKGCRYVVDIGANRGQFALIARKCFPDAMIASFEPLPGPAAIFRQVFAGDARVILHESAVGPEAGQAEIHISARDDSSSLLPITERQSTLFPGTAEAGCQSIRVSPLDKALASEEIAELALLKLDVQGFELQALQGCESLLRNFSWVYAECSFVELYEGQALADEVIAWLRERGFMLSGVYNMTYDKEERVIQADFLFARSNEAA
jgi:FkbM family methyltransferase